MKGKHRVNLVLVLAIVVLGGALSCKGGPNIYVSESVYNFGVVVEGETVSYTFVIENRGDEVLKILDVRTSCGCTTTSLSISVLEPSEEVRLGIKLSTAGYGGLQVSKNIYVESNDPERPEIILRIVGTVINEKAFLIDARDLSGSLMILIDLRPSSFYAVGHLVGAANLPYEEGNWWFDLLPKQVRIVLYDRDGSVSTKVAEKMLALGFMNIQVLTGGLDEWTRRYGVRSIVTVPFIIWLIGYE